jgi:hypothetical protein
VGVSVSPPSGPPGQTFVVTATGLTPGGTARVSISGPGSPYVSTATADASGMAQWWIGSSGTDPAGVYSVTVTDLASGRAGASSFRIT